MAEGNENRDRKGRFKIRNQAAKGRRPRSKQLTTEQVIARADKALTDIGQEKTGDQMGIILAKLISLARTGNTTAAIWLLDRIAPRERVQLSQPLPSPTADPIAFVDELANRAVDGELTVDQAGKLANLARPLIVDEALREMVGELAELRKRIDEFGKQKLRAV